MVDSAVSFSIVLEDAAYDQGYYCRAAKPPSGCHTGCETRDYQKNRTDNVENY